MGTNKKDTRIEYIEVNNEKIYDDTEIANKFNEYLANIGRSLTPLLSKIHSSTYLKHLPPRQKTRFLLNQLPRDFYWKYWVT